MPRHYSWFARLKRRLTRPDRSHDWVRAHDLVLDCHLDVPSMAGIAFGAPVDTLEKLGPPESPTAIAEGNFEYLDDGLAVCTEEGLVAAFCMYWDSNWPPEYESFAGRFYFHGERISLGSGSRLADCLDWFGEPYWRATDEGETLLFYQRGPVEWQFEFSHDLGTLTSLIVVTPPLLADPQTRQFYDIDKPWPPESAAFQTPDPGA